MSMRRLNKYKVTLNFKQALAFVILMENGEGVMGKSPKYFMEKLSAMEYNSEPEGLLDEVNQSKLAAWMKRWKVNEDDEVDSRPAPTLPGLEGGVTPDND